MYQANLGAALNAYRSVGVTSIAESAEPHQLVLMLFNGARAAVAAASGQMQRREISAKCASISSAIAIIDGGLRASLDLNVGGELAKNLHDLYVYMGQRLLIANLRNNAAALAEVALLLEQLGSAWEMITTKPPASAVPHQPGPDTSKSTDITGTAAPAQAPAHAADTGTVRPNRVAAAYGAR